MDVKQDMCFSRGYSASPTGVAYMKKNKSAPSNLASAKLSAPLLPSLKKGSP